MPPHGTLGDYSVYDVGMGSKCLQFINQCGKVFHGTRLFRNGMFCALKLRVVFGLTAPFGRIPAKMAQKGGRQAVFVTFVMFCSRKMTVDPFSAGGHDER
jgi:hypothetical protein